MQDGGGLRSEERHGLAAAIPRIDRRRKSPVRGAFGKIPVPDIFCDSATRSTPPLVGTRLSIGCLMQCA
jgi:hypothetical protein